MKIALIALVLLSTVTLLCAENTNIKNFKNSHIRKSGINLSIDDSWLLSVIQLTIIKVIGLAVMKSLILTKIVLFLLISSGGHQGLTNPPTTTSISVSEKPAVNSTSPVACNMPNDLILLIDSSSSIQPEDYILGLDFSARLGAAWREGHGNNRVSVYVFSETLVKVFNLFESSTLTADEIRAKVLSAPRLAKKTNTHLALRAAASEFKNFTRNVNRNTVVITDGLSSNPMETRLAAMELLMEQVNTFSVGIANAAKDELLFIANNIKERVFTVAQYQQLYSVLRPLSEAVCNA